MGQTRFKCGMGEAKHHLVFTEKTSQPAAGGGGAMKIRPKANSREVTSSSMAAKQTTNRNSTNKRGAPPRRDPGSGTAGSQILFQPTSRREVPVLTSTQAIETN